MKRKQRLEKTARTGRWRSWVLAASLPLALALAACSSDAPEPGTVTTEDTSNAPYPNLASVPDKPPPVSPEEIRARTAEGLAADRANAQYTGTLTAEGTAQPAAAPPGPPPPEPEVEVIQEQVTETEVTSTGAVVEEEVDETEIRKTQVQDGVETVTEVDEVEASETVVQGQEVVEAEVTETQVSETMSPAPAPSATTGGVTEVQSLAEVCRVAEEWEREAYGCDNLPAAGSSAAAPATVTATPAPAPAPVPAPAAQPAPPPPPAYSPTPPPPPAAAPQVASQPGKQEPLSINPPAGSAQPTTQQQTTPTQPLPPAPPAYTQPPATPGAAAPIPVPSAPAGGTTEVTSLAEVCRVANEEERKVYGCDNPAGAQSVTAPTPAPATVGAQPPLVPPQGAVGSGRVDLVGVIFFAHGSSALDGRDAQVLAQIAQLHKQYGGVIRVIGNASSRTGNLSQAEHQLANFEVSLERAGAVAAKLASYGVASTSIITEARSDASPIYHEFMPTGEAGNRRAEIYLEY